MHSAITAIGTALPPYQGTQEQVLQFMANALQLSGDEERKLKILYRSTGIQSRQSVLEDFKNPQGELRINSTAERMQVYEQQALPLAIQAINNCLEQFSDFNLNDITHLITVSCTGMYAPGLDIEIIETLKLSSQVQRTAVNFMGCYGAVSGLKVADAICLANPNAKVLLVSIELCTLHFQKNKAMDNLVASAIFSDGAAAALIQNNPTGKHLLLERFYCDLLSQGKKEMTWRIGNDGFAMFLSAYVPKLVEEGIGALIDKLLHKSQYSLDSIDLFAIHPGGMKILQACENALNITKEQNAFSYEILRCYGNMSSATLLFVLQKLWQQLSEKDHQKSIFSCAFGPGLTLESMLLKVNYS